MLDFHDGFPFWVTNVFVSPEGGGNQLAVVVAGQSLTTERMQQIAADFNFAETTFLADDPTALAPGAPVRTRIFTPRRELPFAGHPVLGTADLVRRLQKSPLPARVILSVGVGEVPVDFSSEHEPAFMTQQSAVFADPPQEIDLAELLSLHDDDIATNMKARLVSTGARFLIAPLAGTAAVAKARIDERAYDRFATTTDTLGIGVFAPLADDCARVTVRVFAPGAGVPEDPATGSHAGCLGAYLAEHFDWRTQRGFVIEQGRSVGRPSEIFVRAEKGAGPRVGGSCTVWAHGRL